MLVFFYQNLKVLTLLMVCNILHYVGRKANLKTVLLLLNSIIHLHACVREEFLLARGHLSVANMMLDR